MSFELDLVPVMYVSAESLINPLFTGSFLFDDKKAYQQKNLTVVKWLLFDFGTGT